MTRCRGIAVALALACFGAGACGDDGGLATSDQSASRAVSQGGPQDIGELRMLIEGGAVPSLALLDEVGFFAEHAFDLPPSSCGGPVCPHPMLAVAPRFDMGNWTMAFVALGTNVSPGEVALRPRHLIVVVEVTGRSDAQVVQLAPALLALHQYLGPQDVVSVITAGREPRRLAEAIPAPHLGEVTLPEPDRTNEEPDAYGGLAVALDLVSSPAYLDFAPHVVLLTEGVASAADPLTITRPRVTALADFEALSTRFADLDAPVSVIALSSERYVRTVPQAIAELTGGSYYYSSSVEDALDALAVEAQTAFTPIARNLELELTAAPGYRIGQVFGARRAITTDAVATLESPVLYIGARAGSEDVEHGRRGGGGGFFVQLIADDEGALEEVSAFELVVRYDDVFTGERRELRSTLTTPLGVGRSPAPDAPFFSDAPRAKPFMAVNMYLAFRAALRLYEARGCGGSLGIQTMMQQSYEWWHRTYDDPDIDADYDLLERLIRNIEARCDQSLYEVPAVELGCFLS